MITLKSPVSSPALVGFNILEVTDYFIGKYCNATIEEVYSDGTKKQRSFTLWMDLPAVIGGDQARPAITAYTNIGQWTDTDAAKRVEEILSAS